METITHEEIKNIREVLSNWKTHSEEKVISVLKFLEEKDLSIEEIKVRSLVIQNLSNNKLIKWISTLGKQDEIAEIKNIKKWKILYKKNKSETDPNPKSISKSDSLNKNENKAKVDQTPKSIININESNGAEKFRDNAFQLFAKVLNPEIGKKLEEKLFAKYNNSDQGYRKDVRLLFSTINSNAELKENIIQGYIPLEKIAECSIETLLSDAQREEIENLKKDQLKARLSEYELEHDQMQTSKLIKCPECFSANTRHKAIQLRSADEPETIFITCKDCGKTSQEN